ncbi:MAG: biotin transporter BioY [Kiritimatiellia bacterium]
MTTASVVGEWVRIRKRFFEWRINAVLVHKLSLAMGAACLTGLLAQTRVYLPFTPVPVTGQTFAALLAGVALGARWGGVSQILYVGLGLAGVPWFSGWTGGVAAVAGPTGGYIIGFVLAAFLVGYFTDKYPGARSFPALIGLMLLGNFAVIHAFGLLHLAGWLAVASGAAPSMTDVFAAGTLPFIPGDLLKVFAAAAAGFMILPKTGSR